jgi:hypothetical protein
MEIQPVLQIDAPSYPSAEVAEAGMLLPRHVPERWRKAKRLAGALAVTLAANASNGCGATVSDSSPPKPVPAVCEPPPAAEGRLITEARDWVRSIYGKPQTQFMFMGAIRVTQPQVNEADAGGGPPSSP